MRPPPSGVPSGAREVESRAARRPRALPGARGGGAVQPQRPRRAHGHGGLAALGAVGAQVGHLHPPLRRLLLRPRNRLRWAPPFGVLRRAPALEHVCTSARDPLLPLSQHRSLQLTLRRPAARSRRRAAVRAPQLAAAPPSVEDPPQMVRTPPASPSAHQRRQLRHSGSIAAPPAPAEHPPSLPPAPRAPPPYHAPPYQPQRDGAEEAGRGVDARAHRRRPLPGGGAGPAGAGGAARHGRPGAPPPLL